MTRVEPNASRGVSITLVRTIAFPLAKVFRAWTDPRILAKWLSSGADVVTAVTVDFREGGRYRIEGCHAEGSAYAITGTYLFVEAPKRIEMTWCYEGPVSGLKGDGSVVRVDFLSLGPARTELTLTHERNPDREAAEGNRVNWGLCLDKLESIAGSEAPAPEPDDPERRDFFSSSHRQLQDRFETRKLADRLEAVLVHDHLKAADAAFITRQNMFFLATTDAYGQPNCSYKGGATGFVTVIDDHTLAYPDYDGNGMHLSAGNIEETAKIALLFIDFDQQARMRVLGKAQVSQTDRLMQRYPGACMIVRVKVEAVFSNCPRYVHRMKLVQESVYVPDSAGASPVPEWKRLQGVADVLGASDAGDAGHQTDLNRTLNRDS